MHPILQGIVALDIDKLSTTRQGFTGPKEETDKLRAIQEEVGALGATFGENLPVGNAAEASRLFQIEALQNAIRALNELPNRNYNNQNEYLGNLTNEIGQVKALLKPFIQWCRLFSVDPAYENLLSMQAKAEKTAEAMGKDLNELFQRAYKELSDQARSIQVLLNEAKDSAQQVRVSDLQRVYIEQAEIHQEANKRWLRWTVVGALGLLVLAVLPFLFGMPASLGFEKDQNHWLSTLLFAIALVPLLVFLGMTNLCAKRAASHAHLATVYEHKASIAKAFIWMSSTETAPELRGEWMRRIVDGLVQFDSSGFIGKESGSATQPISMQVIREASEVAKGGGSQA